VRNEETAEPGLRCLPLRGGADGWVLLNGVTTAPPRQLARWQSETEMGRPASPILPGLDFDFSGVVPDALPLTATDRTFSMAYSLLIGPLTFVASEPKREPIANTQMREGLFAQLKEYFGHVKRLGKIDILTAEGNNRQVRRQTFHFLGKKGRVGGARRQY